MRASMRIFGAPRFPGEQIFSFQKCSFVALKDPLDVFGRQEKRLTKFQDWVWGEAGSPLLFKNFEKLFYLVLKCYMSELMVIIKLSGN